MAATIQAVEQGSCTECDKSGDNWRVKRDVCDNGIDRRLYCECGAFAVVRISEDGLDARRQVSHEDASWNQETED